MSDLEIRELVRRVQLGDPEASHRLGRQILRRSGTILEAVETLAPLISAPSEKRAKSEASYLLTGVLFRDGSPTAFDHFLDLLESREWERQWLAKVIQRKLIDKAWAVKGLDSVGQEWPAAIFEPGGYGIDELKPTEDSRDGDYVEPTIAYARGDEVTTITRLSGPFENTRSDDGFVIFEDSMDVDDIRVPDQSVVSSNDLEHFAVEQGFETVEDWIEDGLDTGTIEKRAGFAASLGWDVIREEGGSGQSIYTWPEVQRRYALEIAFENARWLR